MATTPTFALRPHAENRFRVLKITIEAANNQ
jgi:hypothetical protein